MKEKLKRSIRVFILAVLQFSWLTTYSQLKVRLDITSTELAEKMIHNPAFKDNPRGEGFCWNARYGMDEFIENFRLTQNTAWLDAGFKYCDFLIGQLDTDPEGYKGWIGPYQYDDKYWQDALVGDAILFSGILDFSVLVLEDKGLKQKYGDKANAYVQNAERNFAEKWDKRGTWYDDGPYGAYTGFQKFIDPGKPDVWITEADVNRAGVSHPFNKQMDAGQVFLRLYRITGNQHYKDRAQKIFFTVKSHMQYFDDHYCWNYFEPLTPADVDLNKKETRHGVWVHPWRSGYQAGEVEKIVEAYHYGIVFDETDIKRIINTNLQVMWNKDKIHPRFINSNGLGADNDTTGIGAFKAAYGHSSVTKNAGELWTGLLDFDQTIRDLYELRFKKGDHPIERMRYEETVLNSPPGFKRKYARGKVTVPKIAFTASRELSMVTILPHLINNKEKSIIICQSRKHGDLQIDLYTKSGKPVTNLFKGKIEEGLFMITWDGQDAAKRAINKGDYQIRWTIGTGYREFPVVIE
ncbi:MAG: hypothetical protein ACOH2A_09530 [Sphingobacteriaceae bacterium]